MRLAIFYTFCYLAVFITNFLANYIPINGVGTGEVSARYNSLITPAGPAFSIWGIIYLFLIIWLVQIWIGIFRNKKETSADISHLMIAFPLSCIFNIGWLLVWHYELINLSLFMMLGLLVSLIWVYKGYDNVKVLWKFPFSTYLAWISVATIVNVSVIVIHNEWVLFPEEGVTATVMMMLVATILALYLLHAKRDTFFGLVIIWAFTFIILKNMDIEAIYFGGIGFIAIIFINIVFVYWLRWRSDLSEVAST